MGHDNENESIIALKKYESDQFYKLLLTLVTIIMSDFTNAMQRM